MFVTTSGRSGAPKALHTATYDGTIIYNDPVQVHVDFLNSIFYSFVLRPKKNN
jgi:hypothetical protein